VFDIGQGIVPAPFAKSLIVGDIVDLDNAIGVPSSEREQSKCC